MVESVQESELGVEWLAAQGVAVDPLPVPLLGVAALPSMGRVAFEALLPEQVSFADQSAAPPPALALVGAQFPSRKAPQLVPLALLVAALVEGVAVELGVALPPAPPAPPALALAESPAAQAPSLVNRGSALGEDGPAQLEAKPLDGLFFSGGMLRSRLLAN